MSEKRADNYILTWGETENGWFALHGPFPTERHLTAYGIWWQESHGYDPCWQSVYVTDPNKAPRIVTPLESLWHGDSYGGRNADEIRQAA
jgi:hypothetical protein